MPGGHNRQPAKDLEKGCTNMTKKLLIIDDQTGITKVVGLIARQLGLEFKALNSSATATEEYIDYRPDILMLDMIMPEKDGIDVLNEILLTGIPSRIVLTSGYSDAYLRLGEGVAKFHESGQVSVLKKPFRRADLVELLTELSQED
ncbi:MAG TPA: response regulator [Acetobacteraceae bacterium]|nr:response regulator [Acetobacteraceae bacterium]